MKKQLLTAGGLMFALILSNPAPLNAQIIVNAAAMTYQQHFNTLDTTGANSGNLPPGWAIFESGSSTTTVNNQYKGNSGTATAGDVYSYGSPGSADRALGSLATSGNKSFYGAVFKNNTGVTLTAVAITYRGEQWRRGTAATDTLLFRYSQTASGISDTSANKWTTNIALSLTGIYTGQLTNNALDGNATGNYSIKSDTLQVHVLPGDSLLMAWIDKDANGSDDGLAVDDLSLTFITDLPPVPDHVSITGKYPYGPAIDPATNQINMVFDHAVTQGNGEIALHKQGGSTVLTVTLPSAQITVTDSAAVLSGVLLENNCSYYVTVTEGSFKQAGQSIPSMAITDSTLWTFATADTVIIRPLTSLYESFRECTDTTMGMFRQYNLAGFKTWQCTADGHEDQAAVSMSGGTSSGISDDNADWLIARFALDCAAMDRPRLSFWNKARFTGSVTRTVKISTDYVPGHDPAAATWTTLSIQDLVENPAESWTPVTGVDLSAFKNAPFFLAFTYACGGNGAYELIYDDISVMDDALGIPGEKQDQIDVQVIGTATENNIDLQVTARRAETLTVNIVDLQGRPVFTTLLKTVPGKNRYRLTPAGLPPGLYLLRWNNSMHYTVIKIVIAS